MTNSERALELIKDGMLVGLGTGRAAAAFVDALGQRVKQGLKIKGVPTSQRSADQAKQLGIPLTTLEEVDQLDLDVDGSDEVDPQLNLIKGLGGALVREKIVAASAKKLVILVGTEKVVKTLGDHGVLPVEVVPYALPLCIRRLKALGCPPTPRQKDGKLFVSDNGNNILDCKIQPIANPAKFEQDIRNIPGVVDTGLFLGMADVVYIQDGDNVQVKERKK